MNQLVSGDIICDCLVIGGGPVGSVSASIIAEAGYDVVLIERAVHPDLTLVSLLPATNEVLERLGSRKNR